MNERAPLDHDLIDASGYSRTAEAPGIESSILACLQTDSLLIRHINNLLSHFGDDLLIHVIMYLLCNE